MKKTQGFTLIELLVVVLIIGILSAIALPQYEKAVNRARLTELLNLAKPLVAAQQSVFLETGSYSTEFATLPVSAPAGGTLSKRGSNDVLTYPNGNSVEVAANGGVYAYNAAKEVQISMSSDQSGWGCGAGSQNKSMQAVCKSATGLSSGKSTYCSFGPCVFYSNLQ